MKKILLVIVSLGIFLVFSCAEEKIPTNFLGEWQAVAWKVEGKDAKRNVSSVRFIFNADKSYEAHSGSSKEKGTYYLKGNKLYTTEISKLEKMVEFEQKGNDTLVMNMNRVGTSEQLVLVKKH